MTKRVYLMWLVTIIVLGAVMPILAGEAHPRGPEARSFAERTVRFIGVRRDVLLTLSYPKPDEIVDRTRAGTYDVSDRFPTPLYLEFDYNGFFWQGTFGSVVLQIDILKRPPQMLSWNDLNALADDIRSRGLAHNRAQQANPLASRQEWIDPFVSELNGVPCIQQYVDLRDEPRQELLYYFLFDEDYALQLQVRFVDNGDRPGLTKSDWRARAEAFTGRILSTVMVRVVPTGSSH